jgi:hypothetical protein
MPVIVSDAVITIGVNLHTKVLFRKVVSIRE